MYRLIECVQFGAIRVIHIIAKEKAFEYKIEMNMIQDFLEIQCLSSEKSIKTVLFQSGILVQKYA